MGRGPHPTRRRPGELARQYRGPSPTRTYEGQWGRIYFLDRRRPGEQAVVMPRSARVVLANCPHHVVQRGHNRGVVFVEKGDYEYYLANLRTFKRSFGCRVYGFCLMTNHVHLIVDPGSDVASLGRLLKRLAGRQTRWVNRREGRRGTLWEGRYKSSPIQTEVYLHRCSRYVELNPVRAGLVARPEQYRWSSFAAKIGRAKLDWLDADPCWESLGRDASQRRKQYAAWVGSGVDEAELRFLRLALDRGQLTGNDRFRAEVAQRIGRRIEFRGPGRPKKPDPPRKK